MENSASNSESWLLDERSSELRDIVVDTRNACSPRKESTPDPELHSAISSCTTRYNRALSVSPVCQPGSCALTESRCVLMTPCCSLPHSLSRLHYSSFSTSDSTLLPRCLYMTVIYRHRHYRQPRHWAGQESFRFDARRLIAPFSSNAQSNRISFVGDLDSNSRTGPATLRRDQHRDMRMLQLSF